MSGRPRPATRARTRERDAKNAALEHNKNLCSLTQLPPGVFLRILSELDGATLARLKCVCTWKYGYADIEVVALERVLPLVKGMHMPEFFYLFSPTRQLAVIDKRAIPLSASTVRDGDWVRVRACEATVRAACDEQPADAGGDEEHPTGAYRRYKVGWNSMMAKTLGRVYQVQGGVDAATWVTPVVGLLISDGWACVGGLSITATAPVHNCIPPCKRGWFYPLESLEPM